MNLNFTKFFALLIGTAMSVATMAQPCSNLFFSEYVEGTSGLDKAVEIYNASNQPIDLAEISVRRYSNGNTGTGAVIALSGILQPYETFVIANGGADTSIANHADLLSGSLSFNGNDALALINDTTGDTLDIFGVIGQDPTAVLGWTDPLGNNWSADITLRRKFNIEEGVYSNPANFDPSMEWDSIGVDVFGGLGTHDNSCQNTFSFGPCQNPFFSEYVDGSIQNKALEIYNPTSDTVWLDSMDVQIFNNGSSVPVNSISLDTHFIPPFGKFVLVHDVADASLLATASMVHPDVEFDGNDAIALTKDNNILDLIGEIGIDPGANGWLSSNGTIWTTDNTLKRHFQIDMGQNSASPFIPDMEWDSLGLDSIGDLGFHENVCVPVPGGPCTWPFFSEYIEGTSFNKAIELFNPSPDTLWLDSFEIDIYNNGGTTPTSTISLIGHFIEPHETFVIAHGSADPNIVNLADLTFSIGFNGNDAIALMLDDTVYVDIIGKIGEDPGSGWIGSSNGQVWTQDFTLVRQFQVDKGQGDTSLITFDPSIEWDQMPIDDFSDLGKHSNVCSDTCNVIVNFTVWDETAPGKNDGQIQSFPLNGVAPFSFLWTTGDTTLNLDSLAPGNYGVTVTDATGCVKVDSFVINPANCLLTVSGNTTDASDSSVADGTVSIFVNNFVGPFTISWNNGDTTLFVDSLAWGTYTVTVTDSAGCQVSDTFEVGVESNCILFIDSINIINNLCADDTLGQIDVFATHIDSILYIQDFQGGIPNDFTIWNFDSLTPSTSVAFVNDAWVSIEDPNFPGSGDSIAVSTSWYQETPSIANDWMVTPPITLTNNNILRWLASASSATWPDGYEVRISTTTPDTNAFFSNPAIFAVPAENAFWTEHIIDISAYAGQTVYFAFRNNSNFQELLYIDEIVVAQKSLTSITYNWSNGDTTSQIGNLATGTYNLQISAGNGCTLDTNITIDSPDSLWINFTVQDETPSGASNGAISAAANGGVGPYQYLWFNNDTTQTVSGLSQGWYSLLISDANNCLFLDSAFVDTADACDLLDVQAWSTPQIVPGQADGSAWAQGTISSIFEDFNFILDSSVFAGIEGANQNADCGAISGLALHFDGDTARYLETIDLNTSLGGVLEFGLTIGDGVAPCDGAEAGEDVILEFSTNSGATWDTLNIYDESAFGGVWIDVQEQLPSNAQTSSTRFRWSQLAWTGSGFDNWALDDIELKLNNPLITYAWSNGATGDSITGLAPGTYVVTATDGNCTAVDTVEVDPFTCNVNISFAVVHEQSVGANDGQATAQLNNGFGSVTYNWSNGQTGAIATGLAPGIYQVWASDTAGCVDSAEVEILPVLCSFNLDSI
ncbi:MAG: lamin tail domain-containing protein, partial [Flavobacteriales bacterium]|nr:lamin tail domain-containing protein [Flavobacteriales bacterium]